MTTFSVVINWKNSNPFVYDIANIQLRLYSVSVSSVKLFRLFCFLLLPYGE